jgi:hypothetical protein
MGPFPPYNKVIAFNSKFKGVFVFGCAGSPRMVLR